MSERLTNVSFRLPERLHRAYRILLMEEGSSIQEDLERYVLRRLQEAGRLPKDEPPR